MSQQEKKMCFDCKNRGLQRLAHRQMPTGAFVCEEDFRLRAGWPQLNAKAEALVKSWQKPTPSSQKTATERGVHA